MSIFDHSEQHIAADASASVSSIAPASMPTAPLLSVRSLSAPNFQLSGLPQDYFYPGRLPIQTMSQGFMTNIAPIHTGLPDSYQHFVPQPLEQSPLGQMPCAPTLQYTTYPSDSLNHALQPTHENVANNNSGFGFQQSIHPFQMDQLTSSMNNLETATETKVKMEYQNNGQYISPTSCPSTTPSTDSPDSPHDHSLKSTSPFRFTRGYSWSMHDSGHQHFDIPDEYPVHVFARHGSLGSLYPLTHSHELLEPIQAPVSSPMESIPMVATDSSTSIVSMVSMTSQASSSSDSSSSSPPPRSKSPSKARVRRASLNPDVSSRVFTCGVEECGRLFKRSEHLKRHVRSVHTLEKPFGCPFLMCPKRFSRSDNLNQHIRIHRYDRPNSKSFNSLVPFGGPLD